MMKVAKAIAETNPSFIVHLDILNAWHMSIFASLFPPFYPRSRFHSIGEPPTTPVAVAHALGYACYVVVGDGLYEKAYEIVAAQATS